MVEGPPVSWGVVSGVVSSVYLVYLVTVNVIEIDAGNLSKSLSNFDYKSIDQLCY